MNEFTLSQLTKQEADYIINTLATRPYGEVFQLMEKLVAQIRHQQQNQTSNMVPAEATVQ